MNTKTNALTQADSDAALRDFRHLVASARLPGMSPEATAYLLAGAAQVADRLDRSLSAGGALPQAWSTP